jgi:uncharacterized protein (DUF1778 family)
MTTTIKSKSGNRSAVMTFRASPSERRLIAKAARARKFEEDSAYVRKSVMTQVEMDLADRTEFQIPAKDMQAFLAALDRPVRNKPNLKKLLNEKSILD